MPGRLGLIHFAHGVGASAAAASRTIKYAGAILAIRARVSLFFCFFFFCFFLTFYEPLLYLSYVYSIPHQYHPYAILIGDT